MSKLWLVCTSDDKLILFNPNNGRMQPMIVAKNIQSLLLFNDFFFREMRFLKKKLPWPIKDFF